MDSPEAGSTLPPAPRSRKEDQAAVRSSAEASEGLPDLLGGVGGGDPTATSELFGLAYDQLKRVARGQRRRVGSATVSTTTLVHEAYLKLAGPRGLDVRDEAHLLSIAALAMRQILVDHARRKLARKRGGGRRPISFEEIEGALEDVSGFSRERAEALLALDDSLRRLAERSPRHSRVVECRFFAGMSIRQTAEALGCSPATVKRDWAMAQAWLLRALEEGG